MAPRVSVLLPVYNAAATLPAAVESIVRQSFSDWELLLINDGSTDETQTVAEHFAAADKRIQLLSFTGNRGITAALNAGIEKAQGEYIARMDADDISHPARLQQQTQFLDAHPGIGLAGTLVSHGGDSNVQQGYALYIDWINSLATPETIFINRFIESPFAHPSVMFRKTIAARFGAYRHGDFPEDYELWLRWMSEGVQMARVPEVLLTWHDPPARLSRTDKRYRTEAFHHCKAQYLAEHLRKTVLAPGKKIWLCGAGRITRKRSQSLLVQGIEVNGYIDVDPHKIGRTYNGLPVISLEQLGPPEENFVISYIGNRGAREEIRADLVKRGFVEGTDVIFAA